MSESCVYFGPWGDGMTLGVFSPFVLTHYRVLFNFLFAQLSWWKHWLCWDWFLNGAGLATSDTIALMKQQKSSCLGEIYEWYATSQYNKFIFFHLFHKFSCKKKKSISNWHQSEVWKKKRHFLSNHFQMYHSFIVIALLLFHRMSLIHWSDSLNSPSEEAVLNLLFFSKQTKKTNSRGFTSLFKKKKKEAAFALVRLPQQAN